MNYISPKFEISLFETEDIIATSASEKFKIIDNGNGEGKVEKSKSPTYLSSLVGKLAIIDLKSSSVVQNVLALIQLNGYKLSTEFNRLGEVGALFILHLEKDGNYKLIGFEINPDLFMACLTLHKALQKNKRVNKENTENE